MKKELGLSFILAGCLIFCVVHPAGLAQEAKPQAGVVDSDDDLRRAIQGAGGSENQIILNLEDYLKKYPRSTRRGEIENEIYKLAVKARDRDRAISYAEKLLAGDPDSIEMLTTLVTTLSERKKPGDLPKALEYAEKLVGRFEALIDASPKPKRISAAQWQERKEQGLASVYLVRGRVHADLGNLEQAQADLKKSFRLAPLAGAASSLAEVAEKQKRHDEALDYALQAFVIALATDEEIDFKALRRKLGTLYAAKHQNETGLGDRLLKAYDEFVKARDERLARLESPNINAGVTDPLAFKLTRMDGSTLEMASLRGKVVVMNFWATWCGPCLTELPLFEKTIEKYQGDNDVVFLAVTTDEDRELVAPYLRQYKFKLPVAYAERIDDLFMVNAIPTTIILDRQGQVSFRLRGYNPKDDFVATLSEKIDAAKLK